MILRIVFLAMAIFVFLTGGGTTLITSLQAAAQAEITFEGGPGDSMDQAVIIKGAANGVAGVGAEYQYLQQKFGRQNVEWRLIKQSLRSKNNRHFDLMEIEFKDGSKKNIFFDITEFFGKF